MRLFVMILTELVYYVVMHKFSKQWVTCWFSIDCMESDELIDWYTVEIKKKKE